MFIIVANITDLCRLVNVNSRDPILLDYEDLRDAADAAAFKRIAVKQQADMAALLDIAADRAFLPCDRDDRHAGRASTKATAQWVELLKILSLKVQNLKLNVVSLEDEWDMLRKSIMSRRQPCEFCRASLDAALYAVETLAEERGLFGKSLGGVGKYDLLIANAIHLREVAAAAGRAE